MTFNLIRLGVCGLCFFLLMPSAKLFASSNLTVLAPVTVVGVAVDQEPGKSTLSAEQIKRLPQGNGSLNELLTVMPSVQTSDLADTSLRGGEILPPNVSITGGRFYDNNFMVDGVGNNSFLDPAWHNPEATNEIPGHPQEMFFDTALIDEVRVYRSNIPAEYGGFTGGVVDAKTTDPAAEWSGKFDIRTTCSSWTRFHLDDEQQDGFEDSNSGEQQPRFSKYNGGALVNIPLAEGMGLLASYRNVYSRIPLRHFGKTQDQHRDLKTYFVKYAYDITDRSSVRLTYVQTPFEEERFREESGGSEVKDSWYRIDRGGYRLTAELTHQFDFGEINVIAGYRSSENSRQAPTDYYNWMTRPAGWVGDWEKDWGTKIFSKEGGYGDLESSQESESVSTSFTFNPVETGPVTHNIKIGYGFERLTGTFERKETSYVYTVVDNKKDPALSGVDSSVICNGDTDCVDGEQYATYRSVYAQDSADVTIDAHYFYFQNELRYQRLTLRPGYRLSQDNFMKNIDHDLRLAASFDMFGSGNTLFIGGVNRYHSRPLLTYKLSEAKKPVISEIRTKDSETNMLNPWTLSKLGTSFTRYSELDTPYSDEWTAGIDQALLGGRLKLKYIERSGKDEFASQTNEYITTLNNNGSSKHEEVSVQWERNWKKHYLAINATWQKTETSNENYRVGLEDKALTEQVYYHGELMKKIDLPREDYNRAYVANLIYSATLPYGFVFTNTTRYRSGYEDLEDSEEEQFGPEGEDLAIYEKVKQPESWIFDWRLDWRRDLYRTQGVQLSLEVNNVFNQKVPAGAEEENQTYEMGRQIWAGMEYYF